MNLKPLLLLILLGVTTMAQAAVATFAGGCFWCMQPPYDKTPGVTQTVVGYSGEGKPNPTYEEVSAGGSGYVEAIQITYDESQVSYDTLLDIFWKNIDPFAVNRQFCDVGSQYRAEIFVASDAERAAAEASKQRIEAQLGKPVTVEIVDFNSFYPAEDYHQDYYKKNPFRYKFYRGSCGRDKRLKEVWG